MKAAREAKRAKKEVMKMLKVVARYQQARGFLKHEAPELKIVPSSFVRVGAGTQAIRILRRAPVAAPRRAPTYAAPAQCSDSVGYPSGRCPLAPNFRRSSPARHAGRTIACVPVPSYTVSVGARLCPPSTSLLGRVESSVRRFLSLLTSTMHVVTRLVKPTTTIAAIEMSSPVYNAHATHAAYINGRTMRHAFSADNIDLVPLAQFRADVQYLLEETSPSTMRTYLASRT